MGSQGNVGERKFQSNTQVIGKIGVKMSKNEQKCAKIGKKLAKIDKNALFCTSFSATKTQRHKEKL